MADENAHAGTPAVDDPQIVQAVNVDDSFTVQEQREIFRTMFRAVTAFGRTGNVDHLTQFAENVSGMVHLESQAGFRQTLRDEPVAPPRPEETVGLEEALKLLRG